MIYVLSSRDTGTLIMTTPLSKYSNLCNPVLIQFYIVNFISILTLQARAPPSVLC